MWGRVCLLHRPCSQFHFAIVLPMDPAKICFFSSCMASACLRPFTPSSIFAGYCVISTCTTVYSELYSSLSLLLYTLKTRRHNNSQFDADFFGIYCVIFLASKLLDRQKRRRSFWQDGGVFRSLHLPCRTELSQIFIYRLCSQPVVDNIVLRPLAYVSCRISVGVQLPVFLSSEMTHQMTHPVCFARELPQVFSLWEMDRYISIFQRTPAAAGVRLCCFI